MLAELLTCSFAFFNAADQCSGENAQVKFSSVVSLYETANSLPKGSDRQVASLKRVHKQLKQIVLEYPYSDIAKRINSDDLAAITLRRVEKRIMRFDPEFGIQLDTPILTAETSSEAPTSSENTIETENFEVVDVQPEQHDARKLSSATMEVPQSFITQVIEPPVATLPQSKPTFESAVTDEVTMQEAIVADQEYETVQATLPTPKPDVEVVRTTSHYDTADRSLDASETKAVPKPDIERTSVWSDTIPAGGQLTKSGWRGQLEPAVFILELFQTGQTSRTHISRNYATATNTSPWKIRKLQHNDSAGIFLVSASPTLEVSEKGQVERGFRVVNFDFNSFEVRQSEIEKLRVQIELMKSDPSLMAVIEGHADERGTREHNLALGWKRANQIKAYLVMQGLDPSRIKTVSYGKERPLVEGSGEAAWAKNRRTETVEFFGPKQATEGEASQENHNATHQEALNVDVMPTNDAQIVFEEEVTNIVKAAAENSDNPEAAAIKEIKKTAIERMTNALRAAFPSVNISVSGGDNDKPEVSISTINVLHESDDLEHTVFVQGAVRSHDGGGRTTVNAGVGYRRLAMDDAWLFGANIFYDHELPANHQRASFGLEAKHSAMQITANHYQAISDWKTHRENQERALDGTDLELGVQVPFVPSAMLFTRAFKWKGVQGAGDLKGREHSLRLSGSLSSGWIIEAAHRDYKSRPDEQRVTLTYQVRIGDQMVSEQPESGLISDKIFESRSQKNERLNEVRRSNHITQQTRTVIRYKGV